MPEELASLERKLDYQFSEPALLRNALTHSSLANETRAASGQPVCDNEELEFLGDSVLGFLVAEALVRRFPEFKEGDLSRLKAHLVSAAHLHGVARRLDLGSYLELGRSEEMSGGRAKKTLLVDALEAVIAALYLDGGMDTARAFVAMHVLDAPMFSDEEAGTDIQPAITNFKSALQELAQSRKLPQPRYAIVRERGPEHSKIFTVEVSIGRECSGQAEGRTKKIAAQRAARTAYERLLEGAAPNDGRLPEAPAEPPPAVNG
ncbi:MAG TPA: ribonuclease III [Bryobacteraceae bacterium]|nr:ribonuclease III [Bryobacteraceae bacterium]